ncbi:hypothetical protein SLIQ_21330 [Serratia liquefaciens FK01]|nr:hypothetical protein SLIQ_21330 [Serratia liquefaciens FK01]
MVAIGQQLPAVWRRSLQLLLVIIELPLLLQAALIHLLIIQHTLLLRLLSALVEKLLLRAELGNAVGCSGQS